METQLEKLNAKIFNSHVRSIFKTRLSDGTGVELELSEVEEPSAPPKIELFFVRFRGPHAPRLAQRIYPVEHEKLGSFELFLTAIGQDESGISYEAVFNRVKKNPTGSA